MARLTVSRVSAHRRIRVGPLASVMPDRRCTVPDCDKPHNAHGYCSMHGIRVARHGSTELPPLDTPLITGDIGWHYHTGGHAATRADWKAFLEFVARYFQ